MKEPTNIGLNRTGIATSPIDSKEIIDFADRQGASFLGGDESEIAEIAMDYNREAGPIGSMPPPMTAKGVVQTVVGAITGDRPAVLLDKLGERLAFERTTMRLYQGVLAKFDAKGGFEGGPTRGELEEFTQDKLEHFHNVRRWIENAGGDPTAMTPAADIAGVGLSGIGRIVGDPRVTLDQALNAILAVELVDSASWEMLEDLARELGRDEMAADFRGAVADEHKHVERVRTWVSRFAVKSAQGEIKETKAA